MDAPVKITYFLDVTSSWCYWAEPAWAELQRRFAGQVEFQWKIALMPVDAFPVSKAQCEWFYRRSGTIVRSPFMLNSGWLEPEKMPYKAPNYLAEAAKDFGVMDDRVRLALAHAGLRDGRRIGQWAVAAEVAAGATGLPHATLLARAQSPEVEARVSAASVEFDSLKINQRPAFLVEDRIGDRAVFSGLATAEPLAAAIDAMLKDVAAYTAFAAHFGTVPSA